MKENKSMQTFRLQLLTTHASPATIGHVCLLLVLDEENNFVLKISSKMEILKDFISSNSARINHKETHSFRFNHFLI